MVIVLGDHGAAVQPTSYCRRFEGGTEFAALEVMQICPSSKLDWHLNAGCIAMATGGSSNL